MYVTCAHWACHGSLRTSLGGILLRRAYFELLRVVEATNVIIINQFKFILVHYGSLTSICNTWFTTSSL